MKLSFTKWILKAHQRMMQYLLVFYWFKGAASSDWRKHQNNLMPLRLQMDSVPVAMQRMKVFFFLFLYSFFLMVLLQEFSAEERIKRWRGFKATHLRGLWEVNQMFWGSLFMCAAAGGGGMHAFGMAMSSLSTKPWLLTFLKILFTAGIPHTFV